MCSNKSDVQVSVGELNDNDESVAVSFYVEYVVLVSYGVNVVEVFFYVGKACPFGSPCCAVPLLDGGCRVFV